MELTLSVRGNVASKYIGEKSWNHKSIIAQQVGYLVENWKLESAKLYIQIENSDYERAREFRDHDQHQLFRSINRVRTLKHLTIEIKTLYYENWKHTYDLSILSILEEFYFNDGSFSPVDAIAESLVKYGSSNPRLQKIGLVHQVRLDHSEFYRKSSSKYLELSSKVDLFQGIQFNSSICEKQQTKFCAQFSRLRSVNIYFTEHENLETIYRKLKSFEVLPDLMHLKLLFFKPAIADTYMESQNPIPCLPSVKILQIGSNIRSHTDLCPINWDLLLPNLVILHYDDCYFGCSDQCKIYSQQVEEDAAEALRLTYIRERLQPWKGCTEIKEIYWGNLNSWGSRYALDMNEFWYAHEVEADLKNQTKDD